MIILKLFEVVNYFPDLWLGSSITWELWEAVYDQSVVLIGCYERLTYNTVTMSYQFHSLTGFSVFGYDSHGVRLWSWTISSHILVEQPQQCWSIASTRILERSLQGNKLVLNFFILYWMLFLSRFCRKEWSQNIKIHVNEVKGFWLW